MKSDEHPETETNAIHARSFGQAADLYDTARPGYPEPALRWAFGDDRKSIVDLGAGTGLLTRGMLALGHRVTVVEPDKQMLDTLVARTEGLAGHHCAGAEEIPIADGSADAVSAGQSYHWFDADRALPEIKRVLRVGGVFCPIWNVRDESVDWVRRLSEIVGSSAAELTARLAEEPGYFAPHFRSVEVRKFRHEKPMRAEGLRSLVKSRSQYLAGDRTRRAEILAGVDEVIDSHPALRGGRRFAMPYTTFVFRAVKTG